MHYIWITCIMTEQTKYIYIQFCPLQIHGAHDYLFELLHGDHDWRLLGLNLPSLWIMSLSKTTAISSAIPRQCSLADIFDRMNSRYIGEIKYINLLITKHWR